MCKCDRPDWSRCGICGRSWCGHCDGAPAALCHWCHGRGYSIAPLTRKGKPKRLDLAGRRIRKAMHDRIAASLAAQ